MFGFFRKKHTPEQDYVVDALSYLIQENTTMTANFDALVAAVDAQVSSSAIVAASITTLIGKVSDLTTQLAAVVPEDSTQIDALTEKLKTATDALAAVVASIPQ